MTTPSNSARLSNSGRFPLKTIVLFLAVCAKFLGYLLLASSIQSHGRRNFKEYSYLDDDYPREWQINTGGSVKMPFEDSAWFNFEKSQPGAALWDSQTPGNGTIYLGRQSRPFSIAMFHEIRCISYLRQETLLSHQIREVNKTYTPSRLTSHCLNYLRQMALCRADIDLEPVSILPPSVHEYEYRCNDWTVVYEAVEQNQLALARKALV